MLGAARVVVVSANPRLAAFVTHMLGSAGHDVSTQPTASEARTWLRIHRCELAVVHIDLSAADRDETLSLLGELRAQRSPRVLTLARVRANLDWATLFRDQRLPNMLGMSDDETPDPIDFSVTSAKILSGDIFGVERYLGPIARREDIVVRGSAQKNSVVQRAEDFARDAGCNPRFAQQVAVAADELVTNAVYDAPVDAEGRPRFLNQPRTVALELSPGEEVRVTLASDGRTLCVSAKDPFGSLKPEKAQDYLARCFAGGANQVETKSGGAGLGLFQLFNVARGFVLNISPGIATESIGLFEISRSFKAAASKAKSFNLFVAERKT